MSQIKGVSVYGDQLLPAIRVKGGRTKASDIVEKKVKEEDGEEGKRRRGLRWASCIQERHINSKIPRPSL